MNEITPPVREIIRAQTTYGDFPCLLDANEHAIFDDQINALLAERYRLDAELDGEMESQGGYLTYLVEQVREITGAAGDICGISTAHALREYCDSLMAIVGAAGLYSLHTAEGYVSFEAEELRIKLNKLISDHEQKYGPIGGE